MDDDDQLAAVAALGDRLRRSLYRFVAGAHRAVSRTEAAEETGVTRAAAAFHLDRLVADGLLDVEFRRLGGRRGPGAGRPTKLYRRAAGDVAVSLPPGATTWPPTCWPRPSTTPPGPASRWAWPWPGSPASGATTLAAEVVAGSTSAQAAVDVLADHGYEPVVDGDGLALANCPFHALVGEHRQLVCGLNLALLEGFAAGLTGHPFTARLQPADQHCCVRLGPATPKSPAPPERRRP